MRKRQALAVVLRKLMEEHDLTKADLAQKPGFDDAMISGYLSGRRMARTEIKTKLAAIFGLTLANLDRRISRAEKLTFEAAPTAPPAKRRPAKKPPAKKSSTKKPPKDAEEDPRVTLGTRLRSVLEIAEELRKLDGHAKDIGLHVRRLRKLSAGMAEQSAARRALPRRK